MKNAPRGCALARSATCRKRPRSARKYAKGILFHKKRAPERTKQMKKQGPLTSCDTCVNYVYDDDYGYYLCEGNLDEDEMACIFKQPAFCLPVLPDG